MFQDQIQPLTSELLPEVAALDPLVDGRADLLFPRKEARIDWAAVLHWMRRLSERGGGLAGAELGMPCAKSLPAPIGVTQGYSASVGITPKREERGREFRLRLSRPEGHRREAGEREYGRLQRVGRSTYHIVGRAADVFRAVGLVAWRSSGPGGPPRESGIVFGLEFSEPAMKKSRSKKIYLTIRSSPGTPGRHIQKHHVGMGGSDARVGDRM
ncbi:hypothetical protein C8J57DRAFT_1561695 [Mycena rebaudengoi]|nr:hypothetical protein C8J57DRAFT_1561695 [Mycena rebaudengoi]